MGDVGDDYRIWDGEKRRRKLTRKDKNMEIVCAGNIPFSIEPNGTVRFETNNGIICFYPTTNKFVHKNKVILGDANRAISYVRKLLEQTA